MPENKNHNPAQQMIPGANRDQRFAEVQHAENAGAAMKRIVYYFAGEKGLVLGMLAVVILGTLCGVCAPGLQSNAIYIIAGNRNGSLKTALAGMLTAYLLYSASQLLQGLIGATLSRRIVARMRGELFGKIMDLPIRYLDTHSHGDVMSRMTNDIENISTTVSQSLPSLFSGILTVTGTAQLHPAGTVRQEDSACRSHRKRQDYRSKSAHAFLRY